MAGKVKKILQKSCYYSRKMKQNLMFNTLFEKYFDWAKIKAKKNVFSPIWPPKFKMADKVEKYFEKMLLLKNRATDFNVQQLV